MEKFRILVIPPFFPFPADDGGKICVFGFIDYLRKFHEFHLFVPIRNEIELKQLARLKEIWNDVKIHIVDETPAQSRVTRIKRLVKPFLPSKLLLFYDRISLKFQNRVHTNPIEFYQNPLNTFPFLPFGVKYITELTKILSTNEFDIIQTELTPMLNLVHLFPSRAKRIFVQIESREDILKDYGVKNSINKSFSNYITSNAAFCEYSYMSLYDGVFALNDNDRLIISKNCPNVKVFSSPFAILESQVSKVRHEDYKPINLIFIGGENHFPNYDGLKWFLTDVAPLLKIESPKLYVTGNWRDNTKREFLKLYSKIEFTGFVDDLSKYLANSIAIVPIRLGGGGMRTKVLFAMASNIPVVTTTVASIGIEGKNNIHFLIADSAFDFANHVTDLIMNPIASKRIIQNAEKLVQSRYSQKVVAERRNGYYHEVVNSH